MRKALYVSTIQFGTRYTGDNTYTYKTVPITVFIERARRLGLDVVKCVEYTYNLAPLSTANSYKVVIRYKIRKKKVFEHAVKELLSDTTLSKYFLIKVDK